MVADLSVTSLNLIPVLHLTILISTSDRSLLLSVIRDGAFKTL